VKEIGFMPEAGRSATVLVHGVPAGILDELEPGRKYRFTYLEDYPGPSVSLTMPLDRRVYEYDGFPPFFEGLLPEGDMLENLLRQNKIDSRDYFSQLLAVGRDMVGAVSVMESR